MREHVLWHNGTSIQQCGFLYLEPRLTNPTGFSDLWLMIRRVPRLPGCLQAAVPYHIWSQQSRAGSTKLEYSNCFWTALRGTNWQSLHSIFTIRFVLLCKPSIWSFHERWLSKTMPTYLTFWICSKSLPSSVTHNLGDCESAGLLPNRTTQPLIAFRWSFCFLNQLDTSSRSLMSWCSISGMNLETVHMEVSSANWLVSQRLACLGRSRTYIENRMEPWSTPQVILLVMEIKVSNQTNCILSNNF